MRDSPGNIVSMNNVLLPMNVPVNYLLSTRMLTRRMAMPFFLTHTKMASANISCNYILSRWHTVWKKCSTNWERRMWKCSKAVWFPISEAELRIIATNWVRLVSFQNSNNTSCSGVKITDMRTWCSTVIQRNSITNFRRKPGCTSSCKCHSNHANLETLSGQ